MSLTVFFENTGKFGLLRVCYTILLRFPIKNRVLLFSARAVVIVALPSLWK